MALVCFPSLFKPPFVCLYYLYIFPSIFTPAFISLWIKNWHRNILVSISNPHSPPPPHRARHHFDNCIPWQFDTLLSMTFSWNNAIRNPREGELILSVFRTVVISVTTHILFHNYPQDFSLMVSNQMRLDPYLCLS